MLWHWFNIINTSLSKEKSNWKKILICSNSVIINNKNHREKGEANTYKISYPEYIFLRQLIDLRSSILQRRSLENWQLLCLHPCALVPCNCQWLFFKRLLHKQKLLNWQQLLVKIQGFCRNHFFLSEHGAFWKSDVRVDVWVILWIEHSFYHC